MLDSFVPILEDDFSKKDDNTNFRKFIIGLQNIFDSTYAKGEAEICIRKEVNEALGVPDDENKLRSPTKYIPFKIDRKKLAQEQRLAKVNSYISVAKKRKIGFSLNRSSAVYLDNYDIPDSIYKAIEFNNLTLCEVALEEITPRNYTNIFRTLLWLEEAELNLLMRSRDQKNATITPVRDLFRFDVPGLAEGRPSLMVGDRVCVKTRVGVHKGRIISVGKNDVLFDLGTFVHYNQHIRNRECEVQFFSDRTARRRCQEAIEKFGKLQLPASALFPDKKNLKMGEPLFDVQENDLTFHSTKNEFQKKAIVNMLRSVCRPMPYILFGPPGTGKTSTLVETIHQIYMRRPDMKVLICGNSNSCVYVITEKIVVAGIIPKDRILRVIARYRDKAEELYPQKIKSVTKMFNEIVSFEYYQIFLMTCNQSSAMQGSHLFDFVFIDESGHAQEPDVLIPLTLRKCNGASVIAGDPFQLGPVVISQHANKHGLGQSLLERLFDRLVDKDDPKYDQEYITKLGICYRSDERVMDLSNKFFYNNELTFKHKTLSKWLSHLEVSFPRIFCEVKGKEMREPTNPSWFNREELLTCLGFIYQLCRIGLKGDNLGFITPFKQQFNKMRDLLSATNLDPCKLGTVEEFQGLERDVIIISTVRTEKKNFDIDKKHKLGFLNQEKRFNVAISRAKSLVIVVGDSQILKLDPHWNEYIDTCRQNGSYI